MTSIYDVARETGLSTATVSRAMRGLPSVAPKTRQYVMDTASALGYIPSSSAASLASGRHHAFAAVVPTLDRWFYARVVEGADAALRQENYDLFLVNLGGEHGERDRDFRVPILKKRADAVLALGVEFSHEERQEFRSIVAPVMIVGSPVRGVYSVGIDEAEATGLAMDHLLELGHRDIGHIGGDDTFQLGPSVATMRKEGWRQALRKHGLPASDDHFASGDFSLQQGLLAARKLLALPVRPTAIFAASDEMAFGAFLAAHEAGLSVPGDLSIVGIDDHDYAESFGLTTVRQHPEQQGAVAVRLLLQQLNGTSPRLRSTRTDCNLVVRSSTAPPRRD